MTELRFSAGGQYIGSLVVLLDGTGRPFKNTIRFGARGPGQAMTPLVTDRNPHSITFETQTQRVRISFTGRAGTTYDDLYLDVSSQPTGLWSTVHAARDDHLNRVTLLAIDGLNRPHLLTAPFGGELPCFSEIALPVIAADPPTSGAFLIDNAFDTQQSLWAGGLTQSGKLWLMRTDTTVRWIIDLTPPAGTTTAALVVSDAFSISGSYGVELFLTVQNADHSYRLRVAVLRLDNTPSITTEWKDWGKISARRPSYVRAKDARYLCVPRPGTVYGVNLQYCTASIRASDWGTWHTMAALPGNGSVNSVTAFSWSAKETPMTECAAVIRASDNNLYGLTFTNSTAWTNGNTQSDGDLIATVDGNNFVPLLFVDASSKRLRYIGWAVKEFGPTFGKFITDGTAPPCFAGFYYVTPSQTTQLAVWQGPSGPIVHNILD